jgi:hypothetical protein
MVSRRYTRALSLRLHLRQRAVDAPPVMSALPMRSATGRDPERNSHRRGSKESRALSAPAYTIGPFDGRKRDVFQIEEEEIAPELVSNSAPA